MPGSAAKMPGPAFAHFYHRFDHFLYRPHAVEVGEISTGLRLTSCLHHIAVTRSLGERLVSKSEYLKNGENF
jgi:hypothetical protein